MVTPIAPDSLRIPSWLEDTDICFNIKEVHGRVMQLPNPIAHDETSSFSGFRMQHTDPVALVLILPNTLSWLLYIRESIPELVITGHDPSLGCNAYNLLPSFTLLRSKSLSWSQCAKKNGSR
jgi:hypothetical protein